MKESVVFSSYSLTNSLISEWMEHSSNEGISILSFDPISLDVNLVYDV